MFMKSIDDDRRYGVKKAKKLLVSILDTVRFHWFIRKADLGKLSEKITAVVRTVGPNHLLDDCLRSVKEQNVPASHVVVVENEFPASRSAQVGLDQVETPYFVLVDGDMVLSQTCFARICFILETHSECAEAIARLIDPIAGKLFGVRMYRTDVVSRIGFHPAPEKGEDRYMTRMILTEGYKTIHCHQVVGKHHPVYLPHEVYWKYRFIGQKIGYYDLGRERFGEHLDRVMALWRKEQSELAIYGLSGLLDGIRAEKSNSCLDYRGREEAPGFLALKHFLESK